MVTEALKPFSRVSGGKSQLKVHFVSNIDGSHLAEVLRVMIYFALLFCLSTDRSKRDHFVPCRVKDFHDSRDDDKVIHLLLTRSLISP